LYNTIVKLQKNYLKNNKQWFHKNSLN
jgi:hypothetical protein